MRFGLIRVARREARAMQGFRFAFSNPNTFLISQALHLRGRFEQRCPFSDDNFEVSQVCVEALWQHHPPIAEHPARGRDVMHSLL